MDEQAAGSWPPAGPTSTCGRRPRSGWPRPGRPWPRSFVADPDDIALTHSTTDGRTWPSGRSHGARETASSRPATRTRGPRPAARPARPTASRSTWWTSGRAGTTERRVEAFARAIERPARALVASHVLWTTGAVLPVARAGRPRPRRRRGQRHRRRPVRRRRPRRGRRPGRRCLRGAGAEVLLGPEGMGALWVRRALADRSVPAASGFLAYPAFDPVSGGVRRSGARRFEATNFHRPSVVGFARACGWLSMYVGLPRALDRPAGWLRPEPIASRRSRASPSSPRGPDGHARHVPDRRLAAGTASWRKLGGRVFAIVRDVAAVDAVRMSVGFWNTRRSWTVRPGRWPCLPATRPRPSRRSPARRARQR